MAIRSVVEGGVAEVVIDNPPVNALGSAAWREFADLLAGLGRRAARTCSAW
jgi:hypothetical protein